VDRRKFATRILGTSIVGAVAAMGSVIASIRAVRRSTGAAAVADGDRLVFAMGPNAGQVITRDAVQTGEGVLAFPQGKESNHDNLTMLVRLEPSAYAPPTRVDWTAEGFAAYSAICTHLACTVRFSGEGVAAAPFSHIHCPCHAGVFDPRRGASVMAGPPPRALPQLPVRLNQAGEVVAAGGFAEPVGVATA
jgi:rieske iron-sulfur protein